MLKGIYNKYKKIINYGTILLLITFLLNILLLEEADKTLYLLSLTCGFSSFVILRQNSLTIEKLGFGITRREIERIFLLELLYIIIYSIIYISFDALFIYIINNKINASILRIIEYYLASLFISLFISFIKNNIKNKTKTIYIFLLTIISLIIVIFIENLIIIDILLIIIIIVLYFINRHVFYNDDITSINSKNNE